MGKGGWQDLVGKAVEIEGNFLKCHVKELKVNFDLMARVNPSAFLFFCVV